MRTMPLGRVITLLAVCSAGITLASAQTSDPPQLLPDSPGSMVAQKVVEARLYEGQASSAAPASQQSQSQASPMQKPAGTAAAEAPAITGVAASNPAGTAVAPAKQRRARELFIKVGAILGAGVVVGTVAALASASPSKPPGATDAFRRTSSLR